MKKDLCLNCGNIYDSKLDGAKCDCDNPNVVHLVSCTGCGKELGLIIDDDYCGVEKIYCNDCIMNMGR